MATVKPNSQRIPKILLAKSLLRFVKFLFGLVLLLNISYLFSAINDLKTENKILKERLDLYIASQNNELLQTRRRNLESNQEVLSEKISILEIRRNINTSISELVRELDKAQASISEQHQRALHRENTLEERINELAGIQKAQSRSDVVFNQKNTHEAEKLIENTNQEVTKLQVQRKQINNKVEEMRVELFRLSEGLRAIQDSLVRNDQNKKKYETLLNSYVNKETINAMVIGYNKRTTEFNKQLNSQKETINHLEEELNILKRKVKDSSSGHKDGFFWQNFQHSHFGHGGCGGASNSSNRGFNSNSRFDKKNKQKK